MTFVRFSGAGDILLQEFAKLDPDLAGSALTTFRRVPMRRRSSASASRCCRPTAKTC